MSWSGPRWHQTSGTSPSKNISQFRFDSKLLYIWNHLNEAPHIWRKSIKKYFTIPLLFKTLSPSNSLTTPFGFKTWIWNHLNKAPHIRRNSINKSIPFWFKTLSPSTSNPSKFFSLTLPYGFNILIQNLNLDSLEYSKTHLAQVHQHSLTIQNLNM